MRPVSHLSVAQGCLRSLWKSGSKEALELTRPSGGAVVQRLHRPRPAWPERLVDSTARTDAMWVPSPGPVLRRTPRQMRRAANPTDPSPGRLDGLLQGVASKVGQLATLVPVYHCRRSPLRHDHALVLATCVRGVSVRPGTGSPAPSPPSTNSGPQPYKQVSNSTTSHLQRIMAPARNRQVGGSSPPSGSTDTPIDLRFCRLSA
jgi:hypothetical protein